MILSSGAGGVVLGLGGVLLVGLLDDDGGGAGAVGVGSVAAPLEQAVTANSRTAVVRVPLDLCTP
ncbi:hypothetical protein ACFQ05_13535 [Amycolatopsis umgeniensis]|uniref:Uncharacterized protein n=1 Tax=Amycolatopsis umgeniensis TaxID=336628 RepID=A0A841B4T9_9PSEU|nr:hypothetical protein [Amycolatopsis umgeniensis]MBB5854327.1 hypothetical protein [Amycolatopsis umgeniensis]